MSALTWYFVIAARATDSISEACGCAPALEAAVAQSAPAQNASAVARSLGFSLGKRTMRLLNVGVFFTTYSADIQRASKMFVRGVLFYDFRTLLDGGCSFDDVYSFRSRGREPRVSKIGDFACFFRARAQRGLPSRK